MYYAFDYVCPLFYRLFVWYTNEGMRKDCGGGNSAGSTDTTTTVLADSVWSLQRLTVLLSPVAATGERLFFVYAAHVHRTGERRGQLPPNRTESSGAACGRQHDGHSIYHEYTGDNMETRCAALDLAMKQLGGSRRPSTRWHPAGPASSTHPRTWSLLLVSR
eukprot:GHVU01096292.1.p1 GENE.GHVU01096292.1~~GHVU01096292.1.p1  ORF type:complete len:162 (+),score=5.60 GHVU01096292.1:309-794(+)